MKRIFFIFGFFIYSQTLAYGAVLEGIVRGVEGETVTIENAEKNPKGSLSQELRIKVLNDATLKNVSSINDLRDGQRVKIDAQANKEQGQWDAHYIEVISPDIEHNQL